MFSQRLELGAIHEPRADAQFFQAIHRRADRGQQEVVADAQCEHQLRLLQPVDNSLRVAFGCLRFFELLQRHFIPGDHVPAEVEDQILVVARFRLLEMALGVGIHSEHHVGQHFELDQLLLRQIDILQLETDHEAGHADQIDVLRQPESITRVGI